MAAAKIVTIDIDGDEYSCFVPSVLEAAQFDDRLVYQQEGEFFDNSFEVYTEVAQKFCLTEVPIQDMYLLGYEILKIAAKG